MRIPPPHHLLIIPLPLPSAAHSFSLVEVLVVVGGDALHRHHNHHIHPVDPERVVRRFNEGKGSAAKRLLKDGVHLQAYPCIPDSSPVLM